MGIFYDLLSDSPLFNPDKMIGYTDHEIQRIARLHDVKINGMLYDYLLDIGRCDSGTFAASDITVMVYCTTSIRQFLHRYQEFREQLAESKHEQHVYNKPFLIAVEGVADHMFLATNSSRPDQILCYDENSGKVYDTGRTLYDYIKYWSFEHDDLKRVTEFRLSKDASSRHRYPVGEMIDFSKEMSTANG